MRIEILVERVWVTLPTLIVVSGVANVLWWGLKPLRELICIMVDG